MNRIQIARTVNGELGHDILTEKSESILQAALHMYAEQCDTFALANNDNDNRMYEAWRENEQYAKSIASLLEDAKYTVAVGYSDLDGAPNEGE